jgi:hypothetical protein
LILILVYTQPLASLFEHVPLPPLYWLGLGLYAPALYGLEWLRKSLLRRKEFAGIQSPAAGDEENRA